LAFGLMMITCELVQLGTWSWT